MGLLGKISFFVKCLIAIINIVVVAALCLATYAGYVSPEKHPFCEILSLAFPIPLIINLLFLVFWVIYDYRWAVIPLSGLLLCCQSIRDYCPFNLSHGSKKECLKVMSFNVCNYCLSETKDGINSISQYIVDGDADIVCLQETAFLKKGVEKYVVRQLEKAYPYHDKQRKNWGEIVAVYSRLPIKWGKSLKMKSKNNTSSVFCIDWEGDSLLLINCHLESIGFGKEDKEELRNFVDRKIDDIDEQPLMEKIELSAVKRAKQAEFLAEYLQQNKDKSIILCGDFNSSPVSYPHHILERWLTDCHTAVGNGVEFTYKRNGILVRIDNFFCSSDLKPTACEVDTKFSDSDHYPITCWIKKRAKP